MFLNPNLNVTPPRDDVVGKGSDAASGTSFGSPQQMERHPPGDGPS
jgi:hypothetical protein